MAKLSPKDLSLNWEQPITRYSITSDIPEDMLVLKKIERPEPKKWGQMVIELRKPAIQHFFKGQEGCDDHEPDPKKFKVAISFEEGKRLIFVFNPKEGVPFYKLSKSGSGFGISNRVLIEKIYEFLGLDNNKQKYFLKGKFIDNYGGMGLYSMVPCDFETKLPLFEDELLGN